jgi:hypothetical protein
MKNLTDAFSNFANAPEKRRKVSLLCDWRCNILVTSADIVTNLTGALDEVKKGNVLCAEYVVRRSVCDLVSESQPFVRFSWNSLQTFFKNDVERAFHENRLSESHTLLTGAIIFYLHFPFFDWFGCIESLHVMPSNSCKFHESGRSRIRGCTNSAFIL